MRTLIFAIYPGGVAGSDTGIAAGPPDDPEKIDEALALLQRTASPLIVRTYHAYHDDGHCDQTHTPAGHRFDMVAGFRSAAGNVRGYVEFVRNLVRRYGPDLYSLQITEEPNFTSGPPCIDGPYPNVREALVEGVLAAKAEAQEQGCLNLKVGFNATPTFGPSAEFWSAIGAIGGETLRDALDYVGLDFFPDVFRPIDQSQMEAAVLQALETMRTAWLPAAGIPASTSIHIAEHGWPTGPGRSEEQQVRVIETVVRTIYGASERLNIDRYTLFALRDADSAAAERADDLYYHFGIMRDDYTPKPAFGALCTLIQEYGTAAAL